MNPQKTSQKPPLFDPFEFLKKEYQEISSKVRILPSLTPFRVLTHLSHMSSEKQSCVANFPAND